MEIKSLTRKEQSMVALKGFMMGMADIVPGVSGGTVAFITGVYDNLLASISAVDMQFVKYLLSFQIKKALDHINFTFLFPLLAGVAAAIISMSRVMHFLLESYPTQTWATFFGLIAASIIFIGKTIENPFGVKQAASSLVGIIIGYLIVSVVPTQTSEALPYVFLAGMIGICAMILPGISGAFILLILGKYAYVTGALKAPFIDSNLSIIIVFCLGCGVGILSFSKVLNYLLKHYHNIMMCFLTGFMIGSMKKIWPWKETLESITIRDKVHVLREANILPTQLDGAAMMAIGLMIIGFIAVLSLEYISNKSKEA